MATAVVPGGGPSRPIQLAEAEIAGSDGESDADPNDGTSPVSDVVVKAGSRPSSQSLPRSYRLPQPAAGSGASMLAVEAASYSARKVDSLPGSLVKRISSSPAGESTSGSSSMTSSGHASVGKKKSTGRLLKSFGQFVQKVARQLTTTLNVQPFGNANGSNGSGSRSKTPTRSGDNVLLGEAASEQSGSGGMDRSGSTLPLGVVGIQNHGNTCFMNAVLQCLANTEPLVSYLVTERYRADVRRCARCTSNLRPGSTRGELTESLAGLIKALWKRNMTSDISNDFRALVARHGVQYRGCAQHDAQEFLLWLLDHVHEDINIATKKKYRANKSSIGRPDEAVAAEALANHTRCNNSFIYDLFQALYRSSLTCPGCHHRSNTFDPFLSVSLPIPHKSRQPVYITVVQEASPSDYTSRYVRMGFLVDPEETVNELRWAVAEGTKISEDSLVLIEIDNNGLYRTLCDSSSLSEIENSDLYAVEVNTNCPSADKVTVVVLNRVHNTGVRFGPLLVVRLTKESRTVEIKSAICDEMFRHYRHHESLGLEMDMLKRLQVIGSSPVYIDLAANSELPLQSDGVARLLNFQVYGTGPSHLQATAEWDSCVEDKLKMLASSDCVAEHESVERVRNTPIQSPVSTLDECFQIYTQEERLGADDAWLCPNCHKYQQDAVKALSLWSLPEIFVIHLKRFKQDASQRYKLNTLVMFPVAGLDMSRHVQKSKTPAAATNGTWSEPGSTSASPTVASSSRHSSGSVQSRTSSSSSVTAWLTWKPGRKVPDSGNEFIYDLYAVCNHYGNMQGGHYTAFCKNVATGQWYSFNDNKASEMREEELVTRAAYLLFYQRRSAQPGASGDGHSTGHEWLQQLQSATNNGIPRTVTSHSLDNLIDSDGSTSSSHVTEEALAHRQVEVYATLRRPVDRNAGGLGSLTDSAPAVDASSEADDDVFHTPQSKTASANENEQPVVVNGCNQAAAVSARNSEKLDGGKHSAAIQNGPGDAAARTATATVNSFDNAGDPKSTPDAKKPKSPAVSGSKT